MSLELTALELDAGGTARRRGLAGALAARDDIEVVALRHDGRVRGRVARGLVREFAWLPLGLPAGARRRGVAVCIARPRCPGGTP